MARRIYAPREVQRSENRLDALTIYNIMCR